MFCVAAPRTRHPGRGTSHSRVAAVLPQINFRDHVAQPLSHVPISTILLESFVSCILAIPRLRPHVLKQCLVG
jgi:hypothetical protein